jgi:hypothetical protein
LKFWFPVTVSSAKKLTAAPGVKGKLGVWHRNGFFQATLRGRPLYTFIGDSKKAVATGEGIKSFGGTWHLIKTSATNPGHEHDKQHAQHNRDDHDHPVPVPTLLLNADIKG